MSYETITNGRTAVYFVYDSAGRLLYVGCGANPLVRINGHSHKTWWMSAARVDIEWYDKRTDAEAAERRAIETLNPVHNGVYTVRAILPNPAPIVVADDERATLRRTDVARILDIKETIIKRCVELGWIVPVERITPGWTRGYPRYSPEAVEEFGRRWKAGEYDSLVPER